MMKAHISTTSAMHRLYHHRQPQDRPILLVKRTKENPAPFQGDTTSIILSRQQRSDDTEAIKSVKKNNPAKPVPYLCELKEENNHFRKTGKKEETSNPCFGRGISNNDSYHNYRGQGQRIHTPFITPRDNSEHGINTYQDRDSNNDSKSGFISSPSSFDPSWGYPPKSRQRTWSLSSSRSQPSLAYSDCADSQLSSRQTTPVPNNEECYNTPSNAGQQQMYSPLHASTTPNNINTPTCQYYFTPLSTMAMTRYSSSLTTSDHHTTATTAHSPYPSPYHHHYNRIPSSQCGSTTYLTPIGSGVEQGTPTLRQQQHVSPHRLGSNFRVPNSNHVSSVSNLYCQPVPPHQSQVSNSPQYYHTPTTKSSYEQTNFPPLPTVIASSASTNCNINSENSESHSPSSPLPLIPQSFKNDLHRQKKIKTELCKYYLIGSVSMCPFGSKCNYAHGEKELKYSTLHEMKCAGLVEDIHTYRTHPCFSWVSTGACPFGLRCNGIHDPGIENSKKSGHSWLPHSDTPVNNLKTDLNVDKSYHINLAALHQSNPLVHKLIWEHRPSLVLSGKEGNNEVETKKRGVIVPTVMNGTRGDSGDSDDWSETYELVCNMASLKGGDGRIPKIRRFQKKEVYINPNRMVVSELQRLCIAVHMSYNKNTEDGKESSPHREYVYKPMTLVYNELCMVLQEKYFKLLNQDSWKAEAEKVCGDTNGPGRMDTIPQYIVREVSREEYNAATRRMTCRDMIAVREISFGSLGEAAAKTSIWYDIPNNGIKTCSIQEVKRFKREKQRSNSKQQKNHTTHYHNRYDSNDAVSKYSPYPGSDKTTRSAFLNHPHKPFFHMQPVSDDPVLYDAIRSFLFHRIGVLALREVKKTRRVSDCIRIQRNSKKQLKQLFKNIILHVDACKWPVTAGRETTSEHTPVPMCGTKYALARSSIFRSRWDGFCRSLTSVAGDEDKADVDAIDKTPDRRYGVFRKLAVGQCIDCNDRSLLNLKKGRGSLKGGNNTAWKSILLRPDAQSSNNGWQLITDYYRDRMRELSQDKNMPIGEKNMVMASL